MEGLIPSRCVRRWLNRRCGSSGPSSGRLPRVMSLLVAGPDESCGDGGGLRRDRLRERVLPDDFVDLRPVQHFPFEKGLSKSLQGRHVFGE